MATIKEREQIITEVLAEVDNKLMRIKEESMSGVDKNNLLNEIGNYLIKAGQRTLGGIDFILEETQKGYEKYLINRRINDREKGLFEEIRTDLEKAESPKLKYPEDIIPKLVNVLQLRNVNNDDKINGLLQKEIDKYETGSGDIIEDLVCPKCGNLSLSMGLQGLKVYTNREGVKKAFTGKINCDCLKFTEYKKETQKDIVVEWSVDAYILFILDKDDNSKIKLNAVEFNIEEELRERGLDYKFKS